MRQNLKDFTFLVGMTATLVVIIQVGLPRIGEAWTQVTGRRIVEKEWSSLVAEGAPVAPGGGDVVMIEFGDYQCPACEQAYRTLEPMMRRAEGKVLFRHFPLPIHPFARDAALASICAEEQGEFAEMHRRLFAETDWSRQPDWLEEATRAGVADPAALVACMAGEPAEERLRRDVELAQRLRLRGTPSFVSHSGIIVGVPGSAEFQERLQLPS